MSPSMPLIDCHVHLVGLRNLENLDRLRAEVGTERMNLVCEVRSETVNDNPAGFAAKAEFAERFYVFGGLDHSSYFTDGRVRTPSLAEQVDRLIAIGADGVKLIETKPGGRKSLAEPVDGTYFSGFFARMEETGLPLLWHVADPEEFWNPELTPSWAKQRGWGYDDTFIAKEDLYAEVGNVLRRHPKLRVIFAHFLFLSADLDRASALMDRYEGVCFDLAPGIEMLYNLSKEPDRSRRFFEQRADRIVYGTDIFGSLSTPAARARSGIITRWLEVGDEFRVPEEADFLLGPPEDGVIRGMSLPADALARIYRTNFERIAGDLPRPLDRKLAVEECERIAAAVRAITSDGEKSSEAEAAAARIGA